MPVCGRLCTDSSGKPTIPQDRYVSFNALSGWEESDLLAIEFQEALESTKESPSPDYFRLVAQEFLIHTLRLHKHETGTMPDLADLHAFGASQELRAAMVGRSRDDGDERIREAREYFENEFGQLSRGDQASLLRGLASQLTVLSNRAVIEAFCPRRGSGARRELEGWNREILERPGIIVFSCPPAKFTDGLSRLLGILVLKNFQQSMLMRCDAAFTGNKTRPVLLAVDEAHAFLNKRLGDFLSVSREAKVVTLLLTQSLSQIPRHFRGTVLSNTRTRMVLSVSGETAEELSGLLGDVVEVKEQHSFSESLQGAHDSALCERKTGRSKGVAVNKTFVERERKRWSSHAIGHLGQFRAVAHIFEGNRQRLSEVLETIPWYRLPYYLLNPLEHPHVACSIEGQHTYTKRKGVLCCTECDHTITDAWAIRDYETMKNTIADFAARGGR
ncbi:TraM recognition domain-containing protein [Myxococcota bacterium]